MLQIKPKILIVWELNPEFHFSGARNYNKSTLEKKPVKANMMNIFNYKKINCQFTIKCEKKSIFWCNFKENNNKMNAYSILSIFFYSLKNTSSSNLISFIFEGLDEMNKNWMKELIQIN